MATKLIIRNESTKKIVGKTIVGDSIPECKNATINKYGIKNIVDNFDGTLTVVNPAGRFIFKFSKI